MFNKKIKMRRDSICQTLIKLLLKCLKDFQYRPVHGGQMNPNKYVCTFCGRDWDDALHYGCPAAVINRPVLLRKFCDSEEEFKGIIDKWSQYKQSTSSAQPDNSSLKITPVKQKSMQSFECEKVNELGIKSGTEAMETDSTTDSLAFKQSSSSNIIPSHNIYHIEKEEDEKYFTPSVEAALSAITEDQIFGHICDEIYKDQDMNLQIPAEQEMIDSPKEIPSKTIKSIFFGYDGVIINISEYDTYINVLNSIQEGTQLKKLLNSFERGTGYLLNEAPDILSLVGYVLAKEKCLGEKNPIIENAIDLIHKSGKYKLAILTNNVFWKEGQTTLSIEPDPRFHYIIESCKIGHRKPEAYFYEYALHKMELTANECVFIDTLEKNCLGAEAVGIKSIWLKDGDSSTAIKELEKLLSIKLL